MDPWTAFKHKYLSKYAERIILSKFFGWTVDSQRGGIPNFLNFELVLEFSKPPQNSFIDFPGISYILVQNPSGTRLRASTIRQILVLMGS